METRRIDTSLLPERSTAFVFGSYLTSAVPRDLDLLIIYDIAVCPPSDAYRVHAHFTANLREMAGVPIDLTLLTSTEADRTQFVERSNAIAIETWTGTTSL